MVRWNKMLLFGFCSLIMISVLIPLVTPTEGIESSPLPSQESSPKSAEAPTDNVLIQALTRRYEIHKYGLVYVTDQFQILNNRSSSVTQLDICFSDHEFEHLAFYGAHSLDRASMATRLLPDRINGTRAIEIMLNQPIQPYSTLNVTVNIVYKEMLIYNDTTNAYSVQSQLVPILPYRIMKYATRYVTPTGSTGVVFSIGGAVSGTSKTFTGNNLLTFSNIPLTCNYVNSQVTVMKIEKMVRTIELNPTGYLRVSEEHWLRSYSAPDVTTFSLQVPGNVKSIKAKDDLSEIHDIALADTQNADGTKNVTFTLYGTSTSNRAIIRYKSLFYFILIYELPLKQYFTKSIIRNSFSIEMFTSKSDFLILDQTINIFLRGVAKVKTTNFPLDEGRMDIDGLILTYKTTDVTILHNTNLTMSFNVNFFILNNRAFLIMFICVVILGLYAILKSRGPKEEIEEVATERAIPIRELRQFVVLYEEKNAIQLDLEKADEDLVHRRIQKKIYNKTVKTYSDKIKQINEDIKPFKKILMESAEKVQKVIQQLDYLEAERISVKDSTALLEDRYRKGKLPSRAAYEKLSDEMIKKTDELQKKIDRNLNDLRAYLI